MLDCGGVPGEVFGINERILGAVVAKTAFLAFHCNIFSDKKKH